MRRLTYSVVALTLGALPAVGLAATASAAGALADNGVINSDTSGPARVLADGGVISTNAVIGSGSAIRPADDGVINSRN